MHVIPVRTGIIKQGDDIAHILTSAADIQDGDIIVLSSKAVATAEGAVMDLRTLTPSAEALEWSKKTGRSPAFIEATLKEMHRLNGRIISDVPGALLTAVRPAGLERGVILTANAGMDESNIDEGHAVGWPLHPPRSAEQLRTQIADRSSKNVAVIISDSCCVPARVGVLALGIVCSGLNPFKNEIGSTDLFGKKMTITVEAIADQLATAANFLMGNAAQSIPAVIIRDHGVPLNNYNGWTRGIEPEEDLFKTLF